MANILVFLPPPPLLFPYFVSSFGLWADLLPSVGLATNSTRVSREAFYLISTLSLLCISAIKRFVSDQALEPRVFQPGDVSDHPPHGIAADRKISQPSALFMSDSGGVRVCSSPRSPELGFFLPSPFQMATYPDFWDPPPPLPISDLFYHTSTGDKRGEGERDRGEQKTRFRVRP